MFHMIRVDYPSGWEKLKNLDFEKLAKIKRQLYHADIEWVLGSFGTYPGQGYLVSFNSSYFEKYHGLGDFDFIRTYLPYARKYGMKIISYLNLHWFSYEFAKKHSDWLQINYEGIPSGEKYPLYGNGTTFCINSPWRDWAFRMIEEVMKTGIDGVFLDGPVIYPECCYCDYCKKLFKDETGNDLPEWENWSDPAWKEFLLFRKNSFLRFMKDARKAVKKINKDGFVFINSSHLPNWVIPRYVGDLEPYQDFTLAEAFFHLGTVNDFYFYYFIAKCLKVSNKPSSAAMHNGAGVWHWIPLYPSEVKISISQNLCVKNGIWTAVLNGNDIENKEYWKPIKNILEKVEVKKDIFEKGKQYSTAGLFVSSSTPYFYISNIESIYGSEVVEKEENLVLVKEKEEIKNKKSVCDKITEEEFRGFFEVLTRKHIPFRIVNESTLENDLNELKILILPNSACLSEKEISIIKKFVEKGGKLVMTFESGFYNELGKKRDKNPFFEIEVEGSFPLRNTEQYCVLEEKIGKYESGRLIPRPLYSIKVRSDGGKKVSYIKPSEGLYSYNTEKSEYPTVIRKKLGEGEIIYLSTLSGQFYYSLHPVEWEEILSEIIKEGVDFEVKVDAPSTVITEFYRDNDNWIIHITNSTGDMKRPISSIIPVDVKVELNGKYSISERIFRDGEIVVKNNKKTEIKIKNLSLYEVFYLEKGK